MKKRKRIISDSAKKVIHSWRNYLENYRHEDNLASLKDAINLLLATYEPIKNYDLRQSDNIDLTELQNNLDAVIYEWEKLINTEKEINVLSNKEVYCVYEDFDAYYDNYAYTNGIRD